MKTPTVDTRFTLGPEITAEQEAFLDMYGFLHFEAVATADEVEALRAEMGRLATLHNEQRTTKVNGIPVFYGRGPGGRRFVHRMPFTSTFSSTIREFVTDDRLDPVRRLVGDDARVGESEKDGVVMNRYVNTRGSAYPRLGWHTDGLRDLFYGRMPQQMLNIGLHLDEITPDDGGLRLIPGTHKQGFLSMLLRKPHFVGHKPDRYEICVATKPGDLTIHDGRLWHRVARSSKKGEASLRRTLFVPFLTGPYEPKSSDSPTPGYHRWGRKLRRIGYWASARPWDYLPRRNRDSH